MSDPNRYNFDLNGKIPLLSRLEAMEEACNGDDVPFMVACCRHWIERAAEVRPIPVGERLPECLCDDDAGYSDPVLVYSTDEGWQVARYTRKRYPHRWSETWEREPEELSIRAVTHWMQLPATPKET